MLNTALKAIFGSRNDRLLKQYRKQVETINALEPAVKALSDEDLKARWAEIIPLYDFEYDPVVSAARVEAGIYRHEAHNWCFQHNMPGYDLKPRLPGVSCPTLVTVGRTDASRKSPFTTS